MMPQYEVRFYLADIVRHIEAENEEEAVRTANEMCDKEDFLKNIPKEVYCCDLDVEEIWKDGGVDNYESKIWVKV